MRYTEQQGREKIVETGMDLLRSGLTIRTWGNISARIDEDTILITPSGREIFRMHKPLSLRVSFSTRPVGSGRSFRVRDFFSSIS